MNWNRKNNELSDAIVQAGRLGELLVNLGCDLRFGHGTVYRAPCPVHGGRHHNFQVRVDGNVLPVYWACFSHHCEKKWKPTLLGLVRGVLSARDGGQVSLADAVAYLEAFLGGDAVKKRRRAPAQQAAPPKTLCLTREQVRSRLVIPSPYFMARGFSPSVLDALDVGHSKKMKCSIVPVYDEAGETCVGFLSRSERPTCGRCKKCHEPGRSCRTGERRWDVLKGFPKSAYLFNHAAARRSDASSVLLVEGPGDVFRVSEAGATAVAALGSDLSETQVEKLVRLGKQVIIAFDNDAGGQRGAADVSRRLAAAGVRVLLRSPPAPYADVGEMPAQEVVHWLDG
jgi:hypothetical protein